MDGSVIEVVHFHKHLGVTISNDVNWRKHIKKVATNVGKCLDVLNALKYKLDRTTLERLYVAFIRANFEYAVYLLAYLYPENMSFTLKGPVQRW